MSLLLTSWERVQYPVPGTEHVISFEMKRPGKALAIAIRQAVSRRTAEFSDAIARSGETDEARGARIEALPQAQKAALLEKAISEPNIGRDQLARVFKDSIRNVEGLVVDGEDLTTGEALYEWADKDLEDFVSEQTIERMKLSDSQGKASASRSTSSAAEAALSTASSASLAPNTEREATPQHSTATVTPAAG